MHLTALQCQEDGRSRQQTRHRIRNEIKKKNRVSIRVCAVSTGVNLANKRATRVCRIIKKKKTNCNVSRISHVAFHQASQGRYSLRRKLYDRPRLVLPSKRVEDATGGLPVHGVHIPACVIVRATARLKIIQTTEIMLINRRTRGLALARSRS